jgi:hypothetical protein
MKRFQMNGFAQRFMASPLWARREVDVGSFLEFLFVGVNDSSGTG